MTILTASDGEQQDQKILYCYNDGTEFWTIEKTGESAVSEIGLSKMCEVDRIWLRRISEDIVQKKAVSIKKRLRNAALPLFTSDEKALVELINTSFSYLEPWLEKNIYLDVEIEKNGKKIKPIKADFASDFIDAIADLGNETAKRTRRETSKIGLTSYIQGRTGWLPKQYQSSQESRDRVDEIIQELPRKWELHYDQNWQKEAVRVTGYCWENSSQMALFISKSIYRQLPKDVYKRLIEVNAERKHRHHQHFTEKADERILKNHIQRVYALMLVSNTSDPDHFWRLMERAFGTKDIQLELDLF